MSRYKKLYSEYLKLLNENERYKDKVGLLEGILAQKNQDLSDYRTFIKQLAEYSNKH